jgi:hypothetical protein
VAEDRDLAAVAGPVALEDLDRGRLAGAVRAQQREDLTPVDVQVDPVHGREVGVALPELADLDHALRHRCGA